MIKRPPSLSRLIWNDEWLKVFCTYNQRRAIMKWAYMEKDLQPTRIEIEEGGEAQNKIIVHFKGGKMTF